MGCYKVGKKNCWHLCDVFIELIIFQMWFFSARVRVPQFLINFQLTCSTEAVRLTGAENFFFFFSFCVGMHRREMMLINFTIICLTERRACLGLLLSIYVSHSVATRYTMFWRKVIHRQTRTHRKSQSGFIFWKHTYAHNRAQNKTKLLSLDSIQRQKKKANQFQCN